MFSGKGRLSSAEETMKRIAVVLCLCAMLLPMAARAQTINKGGSVTITDAGIISSESEVVGPDGQSLGWVRFSTGVLTSGSIFGDGTFSATGSIFIIYNNGENGVPKGDVLTGSLVGPVDWTLVGQDGDHHTFKLSGVVVGILYTRPDGDRMHDADHSCEPGAVEPGSGGYHPQGQDMLGHWMFL
jgi:hypothetical protein